jgi:hypothetical protein
MTMAEIVVAGLHAMAESVDAKLDDTESQTICALAWGMSHGGFEGSLDDDQLNWVISAIRAAYVAGREKRMMFKGYG